MASHSSSFSSFSSFSFLLFLFFLLSIYTTNAGFSIDLIHRDHPTESPYFNPSLSHSDRLQSAFQRSISKFSSSKDSFTSKVTPSSINFEYLMTIQVGTPPFKILAIADTGSDLTWSQCLPCTDCYKQIDPIFNPKSSSTYKTLTCKSSFCTQLESECTSKNLCEYSYSYGDYSFTDGVLSKDTFSFASSSNSNHNINSSNVVSLPNVVFGCSHVSNGTFDKYGSGIVGLGGGPLSLVSQISSSIDKKFSYCLVPYNDPNNSTSSLNFGDRAVVTGGVTTPIIPSDPNTYYVLTLKAVYVGNEKVAAAPTPDNNVGGGEGNIIIDSGTTLTRIPSSMLEQVKEKIKNAVMFKQVQDPNGILELCYDVSRAGNKFNYLPVLTFEFSGNATVKLAKYNSYVSVDDGVVCLGIVSGDGGGVSIYGNIAQQNFHIGYDLKKMELTIAPADCTKF